MARIFLRFCAFAAAAGLGLASSTWGATVLPTANLVGRYEASSFSGTHVNGQVIATPWDDSSVNNNNASPVGTPQYSTALGVPTVRFIQADNEGFNASGGPGIGSTSGFTYFGVLRSDSFSQDSTSGGGASYFWDRTVGGNPLVSLKAVTPASGKYGFQTRLNDGSGLGGPSSTTNISNSTLQIVTLRRNPDADRFEIWVDGVLQGTTAVADAALLTPDPILIGNGNGMNRGFTGDFAEILIFNSQLTPEDFNSVGAFLEERYNLNTAFISVPEPTTVAIWSLLGIVMFGTCCVRQRRLARR